MLAPKPIRLLVINPNTSSSITETFAPQLRNLNLLNTQLHYWTAPSITISTSATTTTANSTAVPAVLTSAADILLSARACLPPLLSIAHLYDGFLIACYADHILTSLLQSHVSPKPVVGIFEASLTTAMHLRRGGAESRETFGIVTTGYAYESLLTEGVERFLGAVCPSDSGLLSVSGTDLPESVQILSPSPAAPMCIFGGVAASGFSLEDMRTISSSSKSKSNSNAQALMIQAVKDKIINATRRLVSEENGNVGVICMGGVIIAGLERWVREACVMELGEKRGKEVRIVDQLRAGVITLEGLVRMSY